MNTKTNTQPAPLKHLLDNYTTSHPLRSPSPLPPSSRIDPKRSQRLPPPTSSSPLLWTIPTWIAFLQFIIAKGLHIVWSLIKHFLVGPARRSWGYRMTFIVSVMRNISEHSSLADIVLIRRLISFHSLIPLPADAVVTPITFVVPRRAEEEVAKGFLREWDLNEPGSRELTGEWVVGIDVWKRLKAERRARADAERNRRKAQAQASRLRQSISEKTSSRGIGEVPPPKARKQASSLAGSDDVETPRARASPDWEIGSDILGGAKTSDGEKVIYYVHGGAYYVGNAATHRLVTIGVSKACNARVFAITYRLAPEHVFPLPLHDVLHGYLRLLAPPLSIAPQNIIIAGDSAGGGLSLALCMYLRDEGYQLPAGLVLMSPWVDLTMSCGSWDENADSDVVPMPEADDHLNPVGCYLGPEGIASYLTHPYASPLFGDLHDLPPMLIQSGDSEVLRDEITLLAHKATLAGVNVTHELYEDMVHVFQMFTWLAPAKAAIDSVGRWVRCTLPKIQEEMRKQSPGMGMKLGEGANTDGMEASEGMEVHQSRMVDVDGEEVNSRSLFGAIGGDEGTFMGGERQVPDVARSGHMARTPRPIKGSLQLNIGGNAGIEQPTIDVDSLPESSRSDADSDSGSRSGSPTPTNSPSRSRASLSFTYPASAEQSPTNRDGLPPPSGDSSRRAESQGQDLEYDQDPFSKSAAPPRPTHLRRHTTFALATSSPSTPLHSPTLRRRRPTAGSASLHASPAANFRSPPHSHSGSNPNSNPVSPTPSLRHRLRAGSIALAAPFSPGRAIGGSTTNHSQVHPSTRNRGRAQSQSHSDIHNLVEGYVEGGAANETVVYGAGGEVKSVGVLGDEGEQ